MPLRRLRGGLAHAGRRRHREQSGGAEGGGVQGSSGAGRQQEVEATIQARGQSVEADQGKTFFEQEGYDPIDLRQ